ncbi:hypothetical protein [Fodinicola feengrottensis]|uniref:Secreted protein n=1 Tax=Fodinicola feengrottensis TaxID=435914 RepID=A0ABN2G150_9ACTN|nr:hypothetical protein [Fodinicola feengrottensis]
MKLRTALALAIAIPSVAAGLALPSATVAAAPAAPQLWEVVGGFGSPDACDRYGSGGEAIGRWRTYYCVEDDRPLGTVWDLYADVI